MIDNKDQLTGLVAFSKAHDIKIKWSVFVKVNMGTNRAGLSSGSTELKELIEEILSPAMSEYISLYGFYCHAGHSYAADSKEKANKFLELEIVAANDAAIIAKEIDPSLDIVISVGSTPTSHTSDIIDTSIIDKLAGTLEVHAGNYPFCDLQQIATNCISVDNVACSVLAEVASCYSDRGDRPPGEVLTNAGVIALAREPGPLEGWGKVSTAGYENWIVGRLSQEHGILIPEKDTSPKFPSLGKRLQIIPQHSCITANSYAWYYVTDGDNTVVDIWATWRGW